MIINLATVINWLKPLLALGRVAGLPTIWSNCLAGWLLSGGGDRGRFVALSLGTSCLYLGAMFLNDACDAPVDALIRKSRPIPTGAIPQPSAYSWSVGWFCVGALILVTLGKTAAMLTVLLLACIIFYDLANKSLILAPCLVGASRFLLYLLAGSATTGRLSGLTIWSGLAMGVYVTGVGYLGRPEFHEHSSPPVWPACLLLAPVILAGLVNDDGYRWSGIAFSLLFLVWTAGCLRLFYWCWPRAGRAMVMGLHAGIVLADLLALGGGSFEHCLVFGLWFAGTLMFQRLLPE